MTSNLYYVVHRQFDDIDGVLESNGWKSVSVYDIDTQSMQLVEVYETEIGLSTPTLDDIKLWMDSSEDWNFENYELIEL